MKTAVAADPVDPRAHLRELLWELLLARIRIGQSELHPFGGRPAAVRCRDLEKVRSELRKVSTEDLWEVFRSSLASRVPPAGGSES